MESFAIPKIICQSPMTLLFWIYRFAMNYLLPESVNKEGKKSIDSYIIIFHTVGK